LLVWDDAAKAGCQKAQPLFDPIIKALNPEVLLLTSTVPVLTENYSRYDMGSEAWGEIWAIYSMPATLISNETALQLLNLPNGSVITVTSNPSVTTLFFQTPSFVTFQWIFFTLFLL